MGVISKQAQLDGFGSIAGFRLVLWQLAPLKCQMGELTLYELNLDMDHYKSNHK